MTTDTIEWTINLMGGKSPYELGDKTKHHGQWIQIKDLVRMGDELRVIGVPCVMPSMAAGTKKTIGR